MEHPRRYHVGVYFPNPKNKTVAVMQLVKSYDLLNREMVEYIGLVLTTKQDAELTKDKLRKALKLKYPKFEKLEKLIIQ